MLNFPVAIQLFSIQTDIEKDFPGSLREIKSMGYDGIEFAGLLGYSADEMRSMVNAVGLKAISAHLSLDELLGNTAEIIRTYKNIGCEYLVIPSLQKKRRFGRSEYIQTVRDIESLTAELSAQGMTLLYHNHDMEFTQFDGEYALDILYRNIPTLSSEIDTCWARVAGVNPAALIEKYVGRAPLVHLKDFFMPAGKPACLQEPEGDADAFPPGEEPVDDSGFEFRPVGHGEQDIPAIIKAAERAATRWLVVEQDMPSPGRTAMECAQMSIAYLRGL